MSRAIFLDRDGVLNRAVLVGGRPQPPATPDEFEILPGVEQALAAWRAAGYLLIVVTNQPGGESGGAGRRAVEALHERLRARLPLDDIRVCWRRGTPCYKPEPGMLLAAAAEWGIDLAASYMVGDRWCDIAAGRAAGCHTVLLGDGYGEPALAEPEHRGADLASWTHAFLRPSGGRPAETMIGAGPSAAAPRAPLVLAPAWGPLDPKPGLCLAGPRCDNAGPVAGAAPFRLPGALAAPLAPAELPPARLTTRGGFRGLSRRLCPPGKRRDPRDRLTNLRVKIFADGANAAEMRAQAGLPWIRGFTTNPSLMRKMGVRDYAAFAGEVLAAVAPLPISFEVFADEMRDMEEQARTIAGWGKNAYVKIPITNTCGEATAPLVERLSRAGIPINVTAVFTLAQVRAIAPRLDPTTPAVVSVFAGRIADAGVDPEPLVREAVQILTQAPKAELLWASAREVWNVVQADRTGCHIITLSNEILGKLELLGKDLTDFSLETVRMFHRDALAGRYRIAAAGGSAHG